MYSRTNCCVLTGLIFALGCGNREVPRPVAIAPEPPQARKNTPDDPLVKQARADTEAFLTDLLAGKYDGDTNYAPVARRAKGYTQWTVDTWAVDPDSPETVFVSGKMSGPAGEATFAASVRRQQNGRWMAGTFSGPKSK
jgi:hypothetical protein